jgi:hypothetical protein
VRGEEVDDKVDGRSLEGVARLRQAVGAESAGRGSVR